ncbi:MAG: tetratricopeptide repeat protein [Spirochaetaceae bacterium]|jgi:tetratricopeptide (TPR) repeat protein|nr:tetratricopeptide repeat protein [Spirochaetaceae bacterium]
MKYYTPYLLFPVFLVFLDGALFPQTTAPNPESAAAWQSYYIGRSLESQNRLEDAMPYYGEAARICLDEIDQNRASENSYVVLTWALQRQRRYAEVITWGEQGLRHNAGNHRLLEIMGEAYFYLDDYDRSLRCMERYSSAVSQGDRLPTAYFFIGEIFRLRKKFLHADIAYTTAVRLEPNVPLWWYRLGLVRESLKEYALAAEAYERALRINPAYQDAQAALGRTRRARN